MAKTYLELSDEEIKKRKQLTPEEQEAVDLLMAAAQRLPKTLCIQVDDHPFADEPHLIISKRITKGSCQQVATLRKKSLVF